jgi:hypothetical protein
VLRFAFFMLLCCVSIGNVRAQSDDDSWSLSINGGVLDQPLTLNSSTAPVVTQLTVASGPVASIALDTVSQFMGGGCLASDPGPVGVLGVPADGVRPGGREMAAAWSGTDGAF